MAGVLSRRGTGTETGTQLGPVEAEAEVRVVGRQTRSTKPQKPGERLGTDLPSEASRRNPPR